MSPGKGSYKQKGIEFVAQTCPCKMNGRPLLCFLCGCHNSLLPQQVFIREGNSPKNSKHLQPDPNHGSPTVSHSRVSLKQILCDRVSQGGPADLRIWLIFLLLINTVPRFSFLVHSWLIPYVLFSLLSFSSLLFFLFLLYLLFIIITKQSSASEYSSLECESSCVY